MGEKVWILFSTFHLKPADLDLYCFKVRVLNLEKVMLIVDAC